jgi:hypothetical protein
MLHLDFFSSDKLILITLPKVASRYVGEIFEHNDNCYLTKLSIDYDFSILEINTTQNHDKLFSIKSDTAKQNTEEQWNSILNGNFEKDIIFLYREPYQRIISGIIQEFFGEFDNLKNSFIFKPYIDSIFENISLYNIIKSKEPFELYNMIDDNNDFYKMYEIFLINFIEYESVNLIKRTHVSLYLVYLNDLIKNLITKNKIHLLDIDNLNTDLKNILINYNLKPRPTNIDEESKRSNEKIKNILDNIIQNIEDKQYSKEFINTIDIVNQIIEIENIFYKKIKLIGQNEIRN